MASVLGRVRALWASLGLSPSVKDIGGSKVFVYKQGTGDPVPLPGGRLGSVAGSPSPGRCVWSWLSSQRVFGRRAAFSSYLADQWGLNQSSVGNGEEA